MLKPQVNIFSNYVRNTAANVRSVLAHLNTLSPHPHIHSTRSSPRRVTFSSAWVGVTSLRRVVRQPLNQPLRSLFLFTSRRHIRLLHSWTWSQRLLQCVVVASKTYSVLLSSTRLRRCHFAYVKPARSSAWCAFSTQSVQNMERRDEMLWDSNETADRRRSKIIRNYHKWLLYFGAEPEFQVAPHLSEYIDKLNW